MRRVAVLIASCCMAMGVLGGLAVAAGAPTGDVAAFCAARIEANNARGKVASLSVIEKMVTAAPAAVAQPITSLRDGFKKKGEKLFNSEAGLALLGQIDSWVYDNCPGTRVPAIAIDYEYQGVPTSMPAGIAKFKFTNNAPKENHELIIFKLNDKGADVDPEKFVGMPQGKAQKLVDPSTQAFMFAPPGQSGYSPLNLTPGKYVYACFLPQNGNEKNGEMHAKLGMYGSFTVS